MADVNRTSEEQSLPPWKAGLGFLFCLAMTIELYQLSQFGPACWMGGITGMFLQDWSYRLRDRYDPRREIGNE